MNKKSQTTNKNKIKLFFSKYKNIIIRLLIVCLVILLMIGIGYLILYSLGFTTSESLLALRDKLGDSLLFWLIIGLCQIFQVIFIPITNQIITVPLALIFQDELWKVFLTSFISIYLATIILYLIGRFSGPKFLRWLIGDEKQAKKCQAFLKKGYIFYPLGMLLPLPDDIITLLSGAARFNIVFVIICAFFTRAIDIFCSVFGFGYLTKFPWGIPLLIVGIVLLIVLTILFKLFDKKLFPELKSEEIEENSKDEKIDK